MRHSRPPRGHLSPESPEVSSSTGVEERQPTRCWCWCKPPGCPGEQVGASSDRPTEFPHDPALPVLGVHGRDLKMWPRGDMCTPTCQSVGATPCPLSGDG